jgi:hypothetical protein
MKIKKMASVAKKSAKIVTMTAAVAASLNTTMTAAERAAMECAFADMAEEYGPKAIIVDLHPFHGFIA